MSASTDLSSSGGEAPPGRARILSVGDWLLVLFFERSARWADGTTTAVLAVTLRDFSGEDGAAGSGEERPNKSHLDDADRMVDRDGVLGGVVVTCVSAGDSSSSSASNSSSGSGVTALIVMPSR